MTEGVSGVNGRRIDGHHGRMKIWGVIGSWSFAMSWSASGDA